MKKGSVHLIGRPTYLQSLTKWLGQNDLVKIVTGVRRCGKSKLLELFQSHLWFEGLVNDDNQIISINLEDASQTDEIGLKLTKEQRLISYKELLDFIKKRLQKNKMNYIFLDEIQLLENWERVVNTLRLMDNTDIYLTGSNAYMFSSDLANTFGGRYIEIKMQPYSFAEYFNAYTSVQHLRVKTREEYLEGHTFEGVYNKYVTQGGFPQTVNFLFDQQMIYDYLKDTVYLNTLQKDIVRRFNVGDTNKLDAVVRYLFDNIGNETSLRSIERALKASGQTVSAPSIDTYLKGLMDSYLLYKCERYDIKGKKYLDSNAKYYVVDAGLRTALLGQKDMDFGHVLENVVYLELLRRGYCVSVGKINSGGKTLEVDFVAQKAGGNIEYYQVALYTLDPQVLEREVAPLAAINDNYPKFILSMDAGQGDTNGIKRLNVLQWLLMDPAQEK